MILLNNDVVLTTPTAKVSYRNARVESHSWGVSITVPIDTGRYRTDFFTWDLIKQLTMEDR